MMLLVPFHFFFNKLTDKSPNIYWQINVSFIINQAIKTILRIFFVPTEQMQNHVFVNQSFHCIFEIMFFFLLLQKNLLPSDPFRSCLCLLWKLKKIFQFFSLISKMIYLLETVISQAVLLFSFDRICDHILQKQKDSVKTKKTLKN